MAKINRIIQKTKSEGPGTRFCIWFQGCSRKCDGCFAKNTWDYNKGIYVDNADIVNMIRNEKDIEGITVLGGEPFEQKNDMLQILRDTHDLMLSTIIFTGYKYEELLDMRDETVEQILRMTDVIVDGAYIKALRSFNRPMVGSDNQRFIFLTDRYNISDFPPNKVEIIVKKDGKLLINGMADFTGFIGDEI